MRFTGLPESSRIPGMIAGLLFSLCCGPVFCQGNGVPDAATVRKGLLNYWRSVRVLGCTEVPRYADSDQAIQESPVYKYRWRIDLDGQHVWKRMDRDSGEYSERLIDGGAELSVEARPDGQRINVPPNVPGITPLKVFYNGI